MRSESVVVENEKSVAPSESPALSYRPQRQTESPRAGIGLALVVFMSLALAFVWVVRMPFFQSPDENAHADYAFTLFSTRGLVRTKGALPHTDVDPTIRYLESATGFRSMRHNPDGRVPAGYGTRSFFKSVDSRAPDVSPEFLEHNGRHVPFVSTIYSYFYYALDALAIATAAVASNGSTSVEFLAARSFNLILLACSLLLCFGTLRELRVRPWVALALVATIGFFPLTSWVSAYIQPDNLSFTAVSLVFYLSVRLRREPDALKAACFLGLALALLSLTKTQYFVAVAAPLVLDRALRFAAVKRSALAWLGFGLLVFGPPLIGFWSVEAVVAQGDRQAASLIVMGNGQLAQAAQRGVWSLAAYVVNEVTKAWMSFFYSGFTFSGFWGQISWQRIEISFGSPSVTSAVFAAVAGVSLVVGFLLAVRFVGHVAPGLVRVARGRGAFCAVRLAASDVLLNSYALFVAILIAINAVTDGAAAGEGRYWLPFMLPMLLCATRYAPRGLDRRLRRPFARAILTGVLSYSVIASVAALFTLQRHFYDPPAVTSSDEPLAMIKQLGPYEIESFDDPEVRRLPLGAVVRVEGVAIDSRSDEPAKFVEILIDGRSVARARVDIAHPRLASNFADDDLLKSGFATQLDLRGVRAGRHELRLGVAERLRPATYPSKARIWIDLTPPSRG